MKPKTDEEIIAEIQAGDVLVFEEIVRRYQKKLIYFVAGILRNESEAEEVVQDTFLKIYQNIDNFDIKRRFSSYIYTVSRNEAISVIRKRKNEVSLDDIPEVSQENGFVEDILNKEKHEELKNLLGRLEKTQRKALELYYFKDFSYKEISKELCIPLNTVRTKIKRGKEASKKFLENEK